MEQTTKEIYMGTFEDQGYVIIPGFWDQTTIERLQNAWDEVVGIQARKTNMSEMCLEDRVLELDGSCKQALSEAQGMFETTASAYKAGADDALHGMSRFLLGGAMERPLMVQGPTLIFNIPSSLRRVYTWHAETVWLPKRRSFVNVWNPLFSEKNAGNGTMIVLPGSHKKDNYQFVEYPGKDGAYTQYEIPESEVRSFTPTPINASPGDAVFFHRNLVHSGSLNESSRISHAFVIRLADYGMDMTLSGNMSVRPYVGRDVGFPGLRVMDRLQDRSREGGL